MRVVHADALKKQREDFRAELRSLSEAHADEKRELEAALSERRVEKAERDSPGDAQDDGRPEFRTLPSSTRYARTSPRDPSALSTQPRGKSRPARHPARQAHPSRPRRRRARACAPTSSYACGQRGGALATLQPRWLSGRRPTGSSPRRAASVRVAELTKSGRPVPASAVTVSGGAPASSVQRSTSPRTEGPPPPPPPNWESTVLNDGQVLLFTESLPAEAREGGAAAAKQAGEEEEEEGYAFYVESTGFHTVDFTIDFDGTSNYALVPVSATGQPRGEGAAVNAEAGDGRLSASVTVPPYERVMLSKLRLQDPYEDAALAYSMSWRLHEPDAAEVHSRAIEEHATVAAKLEEAVSWAELPTPRKRAGAVALSSRLTCAMSRKSMSGSTLISLPVSSISASSNAGGDRAETAPRRRRGRRMGRRKGRGRRSRVSSPTRRRTHG